MNIYSNFPKIKKSFDFGTKPSCVFNVVAQGPEFKHTKKHKKIHEKSKYSIRGITATTTTAKEKKKDYVK